MSKLLLGEEPPELGIRDATHIAVVSVRLSEEAVTLFPGSWVTLNDSGEAIEASRSDAIGISDPFGKSVAPGSVFWLCMKPGTTGEVRHAWEHPALDESREKKWAKDVVARVASGFDTTSADMLTLARRHAETGVGLTAGVDMPPDSYEEDYWPRFWEAYRILNPGKPVMHEKAVFDSCAC